jgi:hypothetical protein
MNAGIPILNQAIEDLFGNKLLANEKPNIGIFENKVD